MKPRAPIIVVAFCLLAAPLCADVIVEADFQDGKTDGWGGVGDGNIRLTTYEKNVLALMTNNTVYHYFSDGNVHAWGRVAAESNRIRKFCTEAS